MNETMRRFVWFKGKLREVKARWLWLFRLLDIGFELPAKEQALIEVMQAMEIYSRKCHVYLKA